MKRFFLFLFLAFFLISGQALASDQKLVHGAGTLPHLNLTLSVEPGWEFPTPIIVGLRIDMGVGNRVQLGISESTWLWLNGIEIHSLFNVLKTPNDSDFLSIYFNPGNYIGSSYFGLADVYIIRPGLAYEHRFWKEHRMGFYVKVGINVYIMDVYVGNGEYKLMLNSDSIGLDIRVGYQALLNERFSVALESMSLINIPLEQDVLYEERGEGFGGKLSLSWTFDLKRIPELFQRRANKY